MLIFADVGGKWGKMVDRRLKPVAAAPVILYDPTVTTILWYKARVTSTSSSCTLRLGFVMWIVIDGNVITGTWLRS